MSALPSNLKQEHEFILQKYTQLQDLRDRLRSAVKASDGALIKKLISDLVAAERELAIAQNRAYKLFARQLQLEDLHLMFRMPHYDTFKIFSDRRPTPAYSHEMRSTPLEDLKIVAEMETRTPDDSVKPGTDNVGAEQQPLVDRSQYQRQYGSIRQNDRLFDDEPKNKTWRMVYDSTS